MSDDWQLGDLALCLDAEPDAFDPKARLLKRGMIYIVAAVGRRDNDGQYAIAFSELRDPQSRSKGWAWAVRRFRKIRPHTPDEEDAETIRLLNRVPVGEPA